MIPEWIAVDWGTSSLRVWAMQGEEVVASAASDRGMGVLSPGEYESVLSGLVGDWLGDAPVPVLVCGMAGARQGWAEAAYRAVPCAPVAPGGLTAVPTRDARLQVRIVPGLSQAAPADVMRGEEAQLAGFMALTGLADALVCMPGTHCKWADLREARVQRFSTVMTGELFAALAGHTVLRHSLGEGMDEAAFAEAVQEMLAAPEGLAGALFSVRARALLAGADGAAGRGRLSGLLIGAEIAAHRATWERAPVHLIGAGALIGRYRAAIMLGGGEAVAHEQDPLTLAGLCALRRAMKAAGLEEDI